MRIVVTKVTNITAVRALRHRQFQNFLSKVTLVYDGLVL